MRLAIILLSVAALLSFATMQLHMVAAPSAPVVAAERRERLPAPRENPPNTSEIAPSSTTPAPPLFRAATVPAALQTPRPGERFTLIGIAGRNESRVIFLRDEADQRTIRLRTGDNAGEWTLAETNERCVVLRKGRQRQNLCLG
jgi:hypothetical protein